MYELYIVFLTMPELSNNACMSITVYYLLIVLLYKSFTTRPWGSPHSCEYCESNSASWTHS